MYDVAIIDDEKELALAIEKYFSMFGLSARSWYDEKAVEEIDSNIKVVLLDINLGKSCGFDLISEIKAVPPGCTEVYGKGVDDRKLCFKELQETIVIFF